jgi:hypothetical protein
MFNQFIFADKLIYEQIVYGRTIQMSVNDHNINNNNKKMAADEGKNRRF